MRCFYRLTSTWWFVQRLSGSTSNPTTSSFSTRSTEMFYFAEASASICAVAVSSMSCDLRQMIVRRVCFSSPTEKLNRAGY